MANEFNVIGERKDDDLHLLVLGNDGQHYDYSVAGEQVSPVEPDERWNIDRDPPDTEAVAEAPERDKPQPEPAGETPIG